MKKSHVVMLVAICLLAFFYYYSENFKADQSDLVERKDRVMGAVERSELTEIRLQKGDKQILDVELKPQGWLMKEHLMDPAKMSELANLLTLTKNLSVIAENPGEKELERYGLKSPKAVIEAKVAGEVKSLVLGDMTSVEHTYYAWDQTNDRVVEVPGEFSKVLDVSFREYRANQVLPISREQVAKMELTDAQGETIVVVQEVNKLEGGGEESWWKVAEDSPVQASINRSAIEDFLWNLNSLSVGRYLDRKEEEFKGWKPEGWSLKLTTKEGVEWQIGVGDKVEIKPELRYVRRSSPQEVAVVDFSQYPHFLGMTSRSFGARVLVEAKEPLTGVELRSQKKLWNWQKEKSESGGTHWSVTISEDGVERSRGSSSELPEALSELFAWRWLPIEKVNQELRHLAELELENNKQKKQRYTFWYEPTQQDYLIEGPQGNWMKIEQNVVEIVQKVEQQLQK